MRNFIQSIRGYFYRVIASSIFVVTEFYDSVIQVSPLKQDDLLITNFLNNWFKPKESRVSVIAEVQDIAIEKNQRTALLLNGNLNYDLDIQATLSNIKKQISRNTRLVMVMYNPLLSPLFILAAKMGIRRGDIPVTFITRESFYDLVRLSGYEVVTIKPCVFFPFSALGIGDLINLIFPNIPLIQNLSLVHIAVIRPVIAEQPEKLPSISIIIPARNEFGNIEAALKRMPDFGAKVEIIFVEGHSKDNTWDEIERVRQSYNSIDRPIRAYRQTGKGKADAVRLGFSQAQHELVTILDADLTMPPEMLPRFYQAYCDGLGDFINGNRLTYPMEGEAMQFLNRLGNIFFAKVLSYAMGQRIGDSLCGTKLMSREDYVRMTKWRHQFGDFDPFGDYELLFPASQFALGIIDVPIRYLARIYGSTNIHRFRHGFMLIKMVFVALIRLKLGRIYG
ncbi:MAG: glycosyltransferase family 2 protein [Anaerolineae bacterium]|nr:glycosyltransferase family 2 protein [Anaerolineae bacterium]